MNYELMGQFNIKTPEDYLRFYTETLPTVQDGILSLVWESDPKDARIGFVTKTKDDYGGLYAYRATIPSSFPIDEETTFNSDVGFKYARPITTKEAMKWVKKSNNNQETAQRITICATITIASYIIGVLFPMVNGILFVEALLMGLFVGLVTLLVLFILPFIITDII